MSDCPFNLLFIYVPVPGMALPSPVTRLETLTVLCMPPSCHPHSLSITESCPLFILDNSVVHPTPFSSHLFCPGRGPHALLPGFLTQPLLWSLGLPFTDTMQLPHRALHILTPPARYTNLPNPQAFSWITYFPLFTQFTRFQVSTQDVPSSGRGARSLKISLPPCPLPH